MTLKEQLKGNNLTIFLILISLIISGIFFWSIDYSIHNNILTQQTITIWYIVSSLIFGFTLVWVIYKLYQRKKNKEWPW